MDFCAVNEASVKKKNDAIIPINKGEEVCAPNHSWGPGVRANYLIHYVIYGKGVYYCGPNKFLLQKGQIFVVFPGTVIKYQADENEPWHYTWVTFGGEEVKEVFSQLGITHRNPVFSTNNGQEILDVLRSMPSERSADMQSNLIFTARMYEFLSLLLENKHAPGSGENSYLTTAKQYIKAHYFEDLTVEQVAAHIGMSRKYLFAIFKRALNISPKDYIINYRMERAAAFLKDENLSVGNVAYSVGYKDQMTFSKMFKRKMGISPSLYRKQRQS